MRHPHDLSIPSHSGGPLTRSSIAVLSLSLLCACGESADLDLAPGTPGPWPIEGCAFDYRPCDVRDDACQREKLELTACVRGNEAGPLPPVSVMTAAEFDAFVASESPRPDPDYWEDVLVMLELAEPGALGAKRLRRRVAGEVGAFYRWDEDDVVLIDRGGPFDDVGMNAILVHEFVHALQDREVDLRAYADAHDDDDDTFLAARSVYEGEARLWEDRVRAAMLGLDVEAIDWENRLNELVLRGESWLLEQEGALLAASELVPYTHGARFLYPQWKEKGHDGVLELFADPPRSSKELLLGEREPLSEVTPFPELEPPEGVELYGSSSLGALGIYVYLAAELGREPARERALTWTSDRLEIYVDAASESPIIVWSLDASAEAASSVFGRTRRLLPNTVSRTVGRRQRLAATANSDLALGWAVDGDL